MSEHSTSRLLRVYEEAFKIGLKFFLPFFLLEHLRFYSISLFTLTPDSLRVVLGFLIIYFLAEIRPSLLLLHDFYTIKRHPYAKKWWYIFAQRDVSPLIKGATSTIHGLKEKFLFFYVLALGIGFWLSWTNPGDEFRAYFLFSSAISF